MNLTGSASTCSNGSKGLTATGVCGIWMEHRTSSGVQEGAMLRAASACACQRLPTVNSSCCWAAARFAKARVRNVAALEVDSHFFPNPLGWESAW